MTLYEASVKSTDPATGQPMFHRLLTMRARNAQQVEAHVAALGLTKDAGQPHGAQGELIVYRF